MADTGNPAAGGRRPRPNYKVVNTQLERFAEDLKQIALDGEDQQGKLTSEELVQLDAAITNMEIAQLALGCIQDQAPYGMKEPKKMNRK